MKLLNIKLWLWKAFTANTNHPLRLISLKVNNSYFAMQSSLIYKQSFEKKMKGSVRDSCQELHDSHHLVDKSRF